jgi:hypothetical protein
MLVFAVNGRRLVGLSKDGLQFVPPTDSELNRAAKSATPISARPAGGAAVLEVPAEDSQPAFDVYRPEEIPVDVLAVARAGSSLRSPADIAFGFRQRSLGGGPWYLTLTSGETLRINPV